MATTKAAPGKKGLINFDFLQKLGKVLMTVITLKGSSCKNEYRHPKQFDHPV